MHTKKRPRRAYLPLWFILFASLCSLAAQIATAEEGVRWAQRRPPTATPRAKTDGRKNETTRVVSVRDFGAKGDGVTDDYDALKAAATFICGVPDGTLIFPAGTYHIGRYRILRGPRRNEVTNIRYSGCSGVTISGTGAKISVFGAFHRAADFTSGGYGVSYSVGVTPFEILNSSNFRIQGFELDGNVDQMSRDPNVAEGDNAGILTTNCKNYTIENVNVHHFHTDGIKLGGNSTIADQGAILRNVTSTNNGRQGLSVIQLRTGRIVDSVFADNGRTGAYGVHDPGAGVDVEPNRSVPAVDVKTGMITFDNCRFEENMGPQFVSIWPDRVESIIVRNSTIRATRRDSGPTAFVNAPARGEVLNNIFEMARGHTVALSPPKAERTVGIIRLLFQGNDLRLSDRAGLYSSERMLPIEFVGNRVSVNSSGPERSPLTLGNMDKVENNSFFLSGKGHGGPTRTGPWGLAYVNVKSIRNNRYSTDLPSPQFYQTVYHDSCPTVLDEVFAGAGTFRSVSLKP